MLVDFVAIPTLGVSDLSRARGFYENVLGFTTQSDSAGGVYTAGASAFLVYPSRFAGTNKVTAMPFQVPQDAFDAEVATLRAKGIEFQTFDAEGMTWDNGVGTYADSRAVWFADSDGNILNVEAGMGGA